MSLRTEQTSKPRVDGPIEAPEDPTLPTLFVRAMNGKARRLYDAFAYDLQQSAGMSDGEGLDIGKLWGLRPYLVALCACDENGQRHFDDTDADWIEEHWEGSLITRVAERAIEFNQLGGNAVRDEQKNSASA